MSEIQQRVYIPPSQPLTEEFSRGARFSHRAWCALTGRHRRFSFPAAYIYSQWWLIEFSIRQREMSK